jgi:ribA/ribD-fused uncharacterized protein
MAIEIGCRGFAGQSLWRCARMLGIIGKHRKDLVRSAEKHAEEASRWLWNKREEHWKLRPRELEINQPAITSDKPIDKPVKLATPHQSKKNVKRRVKTKWVTQSQRVNRDTLFFFGFRMPFSNFYNCYFYVDLSGRKGILKAVKIHSVEQLYMYRKSFYFQDHSSCEKIIKAPDAVTTKHLSKFIKGFVSSDWKKASTDVMMECLVRKFTDSDKATDLSETLLKSPAIIVEASTDDRWGIGFSKEQGPYIQKDNWRDGENLLGKLLMALKEYLTNRHNIDANFPDPYNCHATYRKVQRRQFFTYNKQEYDTKEPPPQIPFRLHLQQH